MENRKDWRNIGILSGALILLDLVAFGIFAMKRSFRASHGLVSSEVDPNLIREYFAYHDAVRWIVNVGILLILAFAIYHIFIRKKKGWSLVAILIGTMVLLLGTNYVISLFANLDLGEWFEFLSPWIEATVIYVPILMILRGIHQWFWKKG